MVQAFLWIFRKRTLTIRLTEQPSPETVTSGNTSGGNTGIMGNMGSAGNFGGADNPGPSATAGNGGSAQPLARGLLLARSQEYCSRRKHFKPRVVLMMLSTSVSRSWKVALIGQTHDTF